MQTNKLSDDLMKRNTIMGETLMNQQTTEIPQIVVNSIYGGEFCKESNNIGHEIINLYQDDNGDNYVHLNSNGTIEKGKVSKGDVLLIVQYYSTGKYMVLAKAIIEEI